MPQLGERVNIRRRHNHCELRWRQQARTTIENDVHTGSNSVLVAPITVGAGATIAGRLNGGEGSACSKADSGTRKASHNRKLAASCEAEEIGVR